MEELDSLSVNEEETDIEIKREIEDMNDSGPKNSF